MLTSYFNNNDNKEDGEDGEEPENLKFDDINIFPLFLYIGVDG